MSPGLVAPLSQSGLPQTDGVLVHVLAAHHNTNNRVLSSVSISRRNYDYPGTGRVIGLIYECLGERLENCFSYLAKRVGHGPEATTLKILSRMDSTRSEESPTKEDKDYIRSKFEKLLHYVYNSRPQTRLYALGCIFLLFSTHPDIRDFIPELKRLMENAYSHVTKYTTSGTFDHDDELLITDFADIAFIITTDGDRLLEFGSQLCRLHLAESRWKELAMNLLSYVTHPDLSYFALKYMLDFSREKRNREFLQLHHASCKTSIDCPTCALYEAMLRHSQESDYIRVVSHPATFMRKLYTLIVYATRNLQHSTQEKPLTHTQLIKTRRQMIAINERFFYGLWSAIASIIPIDQLGFEKGLAHICNLSAALFQLRQTEADIDPLRSTVLSSALAVAEVLERKHKSQLADLVVLCEHMQGIFDLYYSAERGDLLERERSFVLEVASKLCSSVEKLLDLVGPKGQSHKELSLVNEKLSSAIAELQEANSRCVVRKNTIEAAVRHLCSNDAFGAPLEISQLNEICQGHVCLTIPHVFRSMSLEPAERDDLLSSLQYPLSWLFEAPTGYLVPRNSIGNENKDIEIGDALGFYVTGHNILTRDFFYLLSEEAHVVKKLWFETGPLSFVRNIAGMSLMTRSGHQGAVDYPENGSWSWFEVSILNGNDVYKDPSIRVREHNGKALSWRSHENRVDSSGFERYVHHFDTHHRIWSELRDGDSLGIFGCARQPAWMCLGREAQLILHLFDGDYVG